ncbi:MAG: hypothetical protein WCD04_04040 [Terriglobia bacterium]
MPQIEVIPYTALQESGKNHKRISLDPEHQYPFSATRRKPFRNCTLSNLFP